MNSKTWSESIDELVEVNRLLREELKRQVDIKNELINTTNILKEEIETLKEEIKNLSLTIETKNRRLRKYGYLNLPPFHG